MPTAYFLIPGLRLPKDAASEILQKADPDALQTLASGFGPPSVQPLVSELTRPFALCSHHLWFWGVIPRGKTTPAHAAYEWLEDFGPTLSTEIWSITLCAEKNGVLMSLDDDPLTSEEIDAVSVPLRKALAPFGFVLQIWDTQLYATRMKDWDSVMRPWSCQAGRSAEEADAIAGNRETAMAAMKAAAAAVRSSAPAETRAAAGRPAPSFAWISGGGRQIRFYPPTRMRAVMSDEPVLRSWAKEAGILCQYVSKIGPKWPEEAPPGDVLAAVSDLWDPWLKHDWDRWLAALPETAAKVRALKEDALSRRKTDQFVLIACGHGSAVTLAAQKKEGFRSRFLARLGKKEQTADLSWIAEEGSAA